jgi:Spy/CpxP family protein refolding chaperone
MHIATMIVAVLFMFTGLSVPAYSEGTEGNQKDRKEWKERMESKRQGLFKELNLTDVQKKQLDENRAKNREVMETLRKSMQESKEQMRQELQKETLDMGKIYQLQGQIKEAQAKITDNRLQGILEVHNILTPEQFKKFSEHMEKQKDRFRQKRSEHREGPADGSQGGPGENPHDGPPDQM